MVFIAASAVTRSGGSVQRLPRRPGLGCVSHPVASVSSVGPNPGASGNGGSVPPGLISLGRGLWSRSPPLNGHEQLQRR